MTLRRHPLDIGSLVIGLVFLGVVVAWVLFEVDVVSDDDAAWALPVVLITAGVLGVVLAATKERRSRRLVAAVHPAPTTTDWRRPVGAPEAPPRHSTDAETATTRDHGTHPETKEDDDE